MMIYIPDFFGSSTASKSSLEIVGAGGASVLVGGTSTVTVRREAGPEEEVELGAAGGGKEKGDAADEPCVAGGANGKGDDEPGAAVVGNGKGDPGEKPDWLFCVSICPIMVLNACCMAYF